MTIITKPKIDKKSVSNKPLEKPLVGSECSGVGGMDKDDLSRMEMEMWLSPSLRRRISTTTTVCVFITALLVMSICIIGGVYFYRQITQHQRMSRFRGWCGIPVKKDALHIRHQDYRLGPNKPILKDNPQADWLMSHNQFREEFDLDLQSELYERIEVPDFGYGRRGEFIHDFKMNKTGIIDLSTRRCFVMSLDRKHVLPPRPLLHLISQMWIGYYNVDTKVIVRTMRVVQPPIYDLNTQGSYIAHNCANYLTFLLTDVQDERRRRSAAAEEEEKEGEGASSEGKSFRVAEFAGQGIVEYTILEE